MTTAADLGISDEDNDTAGVRTVEITDPQLGLGIIVEIGEADGALVSLNLTALTPMGSARLATVLPHLGLPLLPVPSLRIPPINHHTWASTLPPSPRTGAADDFASLQSATPPGDAGPAGTSPTEQSVGPASPTYTPPTHPDDDTSANGRKRRPRTPVPPDDELAMVVQALGDRATTDEIAKHYDVARATAGRWVKQARDRGAL